MSVFSDLIVTKGVQLFLDHNETSGTAAVDASGNSRNGIYNGAPTLGVAGLLSNGDAANKAFKTASGSGQYCSVSSAAWMNGWTQMTVMTIVELESSLDTDNGDALVTRYSGAGFQWLVWRTPGNKFGFQVITSAGTFNANGVDTPILDVPYAVFGVWTGTRLKVYYARMDVADPVLTLGADIAISGTIAQSSAPIEVGRYSSSANTTPTAIFDVTVVDNEAWDVAFMEEVLLAATSIPPGVPTGLSSSGTPYEATISWSASTGDVTKYELRLDGGSVVDSGADLSHTFTGLIPDTEYTVEVRAVGPGGTSGWASVVFTTPTAPPKELSWDAPNDRYYEHGIDRGVLYPTGQDPVAWNGITGFDEGTNEGASTILYRDGMIYLADVDASDFSGKLTAIFYPDEFAECLGKPMVADGLFIDNQKPKRFGLSYRSLIGSGQDGDMFGYQIHLVYNAMASIGTRQRRTLGKETAPLEFNFNIVATPVKLAGYRPSAHYILDTRFMSQATIDELEGILYGVGSVPGELPDPTVLHDLLNFGDAIVVKVATDGTVTITGSYGNVHLLDPDTAEVKNVNAVNNGAGDITISDGGNTDVIILP